MLVFDKSDVGLMKVEKINKKKTSLCLPVLILAAYFFVGCASTTQSVPFPDQSVPIKNLEYARIYVMRPSLLGCAIPLNVFDNRKLIGVIGPKGYLSWEREPGEVVLESRAENTAHYVLNVKKGQSYYIKQVAKIGIIMARVGFYELTAEKGKEILAKSHPPKIKTLDISIKEISF